MTETQTTATPKAHTGRCPVKGCRYARQVLVARSGVERTRSGRTIPVVTRSDFARATIIDPSAAVVQYVSCPEHGRRLDWTAINGRYAQDAKCDARCTGAIGHECECECGGTNHGIDHR